ncbi:hypothetical protein Tco_1296529 [Tanacetum coccineum]
MTVPFLGQHSGGEDDTTTPATKEQIEGYLSALKSLVKEHNSWENVSPIRLDFDENGNNTRTHEIVTRKEIGDADLKKHFKEAQTLDGNARGWFERLRTDSIDGWAERREQFTAKFSTRRACFKDPTEITKIVRKANETLVAFKERWIVETSFIMGVPEVMKISPFMDGHKCPELAKRYSNKVPKTVDEMMVRLDDFVRSEKAFANTELPKGEASEVSRRTAGPVNRREDRFIRGGYGADRRRSDGRNTTPTSQAQPQLAHQTPQGNPGFRTPTELTATKAHAAPTQEIKPR